MTQKVNPSPQRPASSFKTAGAIAYGGGSINGYIIPSDETTELAIQDNSIDQTQLRAFSETHNTSSLDITIDGGEAFVFGAWVCIDTTTTVSLAQNTSNQKVFIGWDKNQPNNTIIGTEDKFSSTSLDTDKKILLYSIDTNSNGVTNITDERQIGKSQTLEKLTVNNLTANDGTIDGLKIPDDINDTRNAVNQLFIDNARQDFELGLNIIDMDNGQFEIYANDKEIANSSNVNLNLGSPLNGKGTVSIASSATTGFTEHDIEDYGLLPNSVVVTDDINTNPQNGTVKYEIEDENGNIVTIPRSQLNQSVDISDTIETYAVSTRAVLERNSTTDTSPVLDAYSVYVSGQKPNDYLDAQVTSVSEV
jgi:hypothetical protein